jgi:hypothetical protein
MRKIATMCVAAYTPTMLDWSQVPPLTRTPCGPQCAPKGARPGALRALPTPP